MTTTVNLSWGSMVLDPVTGVLLNNQMDDFATTNATNAFGLPPSRENRVQPGKRPLSSMSPTILLRDGDVALVLGASGGPTIMTSVTQVIVQVLQFGRNVREAIAFKRVHNMLFPDVTLAEPWLPLRLGMGLRLRGHEVSPMIKALADGHRIGNVQAISVSGTGAIEAWSDPRKDGLPAGF